GRPIESGPAGRGASDLGPRVRLRRERRPAGGRLPSELPRPSLDDGEAEPLLAFSARSPRYVRLFPILLKMFEIWSRRNSIATMTATAITAMIRAYSTRPWPSS